MVEVTGRSLKLFATENITGNKRSRPSHDDDLVDDLASQMILTLTTMMTKLMVLFSIIHFLVQQVVLLQQLRNKLRGASYQVQQLLFRELLTATVGYHHQLVDLQL